MNSFLAIGTGYFIAWIISLILVRMGVESVGSWLAMLADSRHGRLSNFVALAAFFLLPLVYCLIGFSWFYKVLRKRST